MSEGFSVKGKIPSQCSDTELMEFVELVEKGEEVFGNNLVDRVRNSEWIFFLRVDGDLEGVAALKNPLPQHRESIKRDTGISVEVVDYPYELGYIVVAPEARGRGYSSCLASAALAVVKAGLFATSRTDNFTMHRTLIKFHFEKAGQIYKSRNRDSNLQLFLLRR